jgi:hypothetical protein
VIRRSLIGIGIGVVLVVGCSSPTPTTAPTIEITIDPLPGQVVTVTTAPIETDEVYLERPFGAGSLIVGFSSDTSGNRCISYTIRNADTVQSFNERCATSLDANMIAVQGVERDSNGTVYTVVVGRVATDQVSVVAIEYDDGSTLTPNVEGRGFVVISEGQRRALRAVPINERGDTVGTIYEF